MNYIKILLYKVKMDNFYHSQIWKSNLATISPDILPHFRLYQSDISFQIIKKQPI